MTKSKANFIRITANMAVFLLLYFISTLFQSDFWGNILSPLNAFTAAGILIFAYMKSKRSEKIRVTFVLVVLACSVWGIADIIWAIIEFGGGSPDDNPILWVIYVIPNCILLFSLVVFAVYQFRKWDLVQFSIDLIINGLLVAVAFWIVFLRKDYTILNVLIESDFTSILSISTDIVICIIMFSWILSVRGGKIPVFLGIMSFGMVLFALSDLLYYYLDYHNLYLPNTVIDFAYILSLAIIAFGALWKVYKNSSLFDFSVMTNVGDRRRWVNLLFFPIFTAFLMVTGILEVKMNVFDLLTFAILIFIYWAACKYIQISLENKALLNNQNEILKQRVAEQVTELTFLANQDTLTTLFNRRYFMTCLDEMLEKKLPNETLALFLIDMDRFKTINDTFGHDVGDKVLIDISYRMIAWNNYGATISRLGGDEFAVMLVGKYTHKDIEDLCQEIIGVYNEPVSIGENTLSLTSSVGVAVLTTDDCNGNTLLQNADIAMYRAKAQGYNRYQVYDAFMSKDFKKALEIEALLRQTDSEKDFELYYQPQYELPGKELIGAEALIRWNNQEHGFISPNVFIPIAEQIDYIFKIGEWVMKETVRQAEKWNKEFELPLKIGFNISPKQFQDENFMNLVKTLIIVEGANPALLDAEITESVMMSNEDILSDAFETFHELGITVSIDDFGSGYSSLGNLNKFPFDRIKIDKSLIDNLNIKNINGTSIVQAAINMAHATGIKTIAEGVETSEQLDLLTKLDCDQVQGYFLGRPVPAVVFEERYIKPYLKDNGVDSEVC